MARCGISLLLLWLLAWLREGLTGSSAAGVETVFSVRLNATAQGQCSLQRPLVDRGIFSGSSFVQTSSTLGRRARLEAEAPARHAPTWQDGTIQQREASTKAAPVAWQLAVPQVGTNTASHGKSFKPRFIAKIFDFSNWGWMTLLLPITALTVIVAILCYDIFDEGQQQPRNIRDRTLSARLRNGPSSFGAVQGLFLCFACGAVVHATIVIPESYSLAADLGHDASWSGWFIGAAWPLGCLSAPLAWYALTVPWSQASVKVLVLSDCAILAVSALVYGLAAAPPNNWSWIAGMSVKGRTWMLVASRAAMGLAWGTGSPCLRIIAQRVSPTEELLRLNVWYSFFDALGAGLGPFLSSLVCTVLGLQGVGVRSAAPLYFMAGFWAVMMACIFVLLPSNLEDLLSTKHELDKIAGLSSSTGDGMPQVELSEGESRRRRKLWLLALAFCLDRILMLSALEAASALVLEREFQWGHKAIGLVVGAAFLVGVPGLAGIEITRRKAQVSDTSALLALAVSCMAVTLLLFPVVGRLVQRPQHGGPLLIVVADAVIFPTAFLINGIVDGLALQHRVPGTWLSPESMAVARVAIVGMAGRPVGPWAARTLIESEGRAAYAGAQLALASLLFLGSLEIRNIFADVKNKD